MKRRTFLALISATGSNLLSLQAFDRSPAAKLDYEQIRERLAGMKLLITPFSHVDWAWVNSRQWMIHRHSIVLAEALNLVKSQPGFRFYVETWNEQFDTFLERRPEGVPEMRRAVQDGKIAICGAFCNQHPSWMEQEGYIRNMILGRRLFENFAPGLNLEVMVHNDVTPGPWQMPQILTKGGYRYFHANRPDEGMTADGIPRDFVWVGPDGSKLLTSRGFICGFMNADSLPHDFATNWGNAVETVYEKEIGYRLGPPGGEILELPFGCDDSRPLRSWLNISAEPLLPIGEFIRDWNQREKTPLEFGTPIEFFHELDEERARLPVHDGLLDPCMWTFWYGLNGNQGLRYWRTQADQALVNSEIWWSCAHTLGDTYPEERHQELWRNLLRAYSHAQMWLFAADYAEQLDRVQTSLSLGRKLSNEAANAIAGRINVKDDTSSVVLFNELPWERTEVIPVWAELQDVTATNLRVRDPQGNPIPFQPIDTNWFEVTKPPTTIREANLLVRVRVPAMGYTTLYFEPAPGHIQPPETSSTADSLETEFATLQFSGRGVESLRDNQTGALYRLPGNIIFNEIKDTGPDHYGPVVNTLAWTNAELTRVVRGPLRSSFTLRGDLGPHHITLTGHLYPHSRRLAWEACIDSAGGSGHFMTKVGLPAPGRLVADTHFCVEDRDVSKIHYAGGERLRKNVFYGAHWVDYTDSQAGMCLVGTTGEKGYQYFPDENTLGHFLLMVVPPDLKTWERFVTLAREGRGLQYFSYQLLFHTGDWKSSNIVRRALECSHAIIPVFPNQRRLPKERTLPEEKSFASLSPDTVQCSAFYRDRGRFILRVWESTGSGTQVTVELPVAVTSAKEIDFNDKPLSKQMSVSGKTVRFDIQPWEIVTLAIA